jgi:hypothetical protein
MTSLEEIATQLINGKIDSKKAKDLVGNRIIKTKKIKKKSSEIVCEEDNYLSVKDKNGFEKANLSFYFDEDLFGERYLWLNSIESKKSGEGYFSLLFDKVKSLANKNNASHMLLQVDSYNDRAVSIYESLGFYSLGEFETVSENIDRITMRKDL